MAVEAARGCGFRKVGGLYLAGEYFGVPCCRMPTEITNCSCCGAGIKFSRGIQWLLPKAIFTRAAHCVTNAVAKWVPASKELAAATGGATQMKVFEDDPRMNSCALAFIQNTTEKVALMWVGEQHYPTPEDFEKEGVAQGFSKRISWLPREMVIGKTRVFLAHKKGMKCPECNGEGFTYNDRMGGAVGDAPESVKVDCARCKTTGYLPAVFTSFVPQRLERIVTVTMKAIADAWIAAENGAQPASGKVGEPKRLSVEDSGYAVQFLSDFDEVPPNGATKQDLIDGAEEKMREYHWVYLDAKRGITLVVVPDDDPDHLQTERKRRSFPKRGEGKSPSPAQGPETQSLEDFFDGLTLKDLPKVDFFQGEEE